MDSVDENHEIGAPPSVHQCGAFSAFFQDARAIEQFGTQLPSDDSPDYIVAAVIVAKAD
jgi:hypothetical protein